MMKTLTILLASLLFCPVSFAESGLPYQNPALSDEERVEDLIGRMTLGEKIGQMSQYVGIEHIRKSEKNMTWEEMQAGDAQGMYPDLHSSKMPALIERGEIGSFLHVKNPSEAPT